MALGKGCGDVFQCLPCEAPVSRSWPWVDPSMLSAQLGQTNLRAALSVPEVASVCGFRSGGLQARCSSAITISFSSPSYSCLWKVFLQLPQSAARITCLTFPLLQFKCNSWNKSKRKISNTFPCSWNVAAWRGVHRVSLFWALTSEK